MAPFFIWLDYGVDEYNVDIDYADGLKKSFGSLLEEGSLKIVFLVDDEEDLRGRNGCDLLLENSCLFSFFRSILYNYNN